MCSSSAVTNLPLSPHTAVFCQFSQLRVWPSTVQELCRHLSRGHCMVLSHRKYFRNFSSVHNDHAVYSVNMKGNLQNSLCLDHFLGAETMRASVFLLLASLQYIRFCPGVDSFHGSSVRLWRFMPAAVSPTCSLSSSCFYSSFLRHGSRSASALVSWSTPWAQVGAPP